MTTITITSVLTRTDTSVPFIKFGGNTDLIALIDALEALQISTSNTITIDGLTAERTMTMSDTAHATYVALLSTHSAGVSQEAARRAANNITVSTSVA